MNPPYQELKPGFKKSFPLWDKFVIRAIDNVVEGGYLVAVHPSGWRNVDGIFKKVQKTFKERQILYLEIHNVSDGIKVFGAETNYDFYCLKNTKNERNFITKIKCQGGKIERVNISNMEFIPNGMFTEFNKLLAKPGEEKVEILHSYSAYETRKDYMSKIKTAEFKYPIISLVRKNGEVEFQYSNTKSNGHFGISKVVWSNARITSIGTYLDANGEYGLTQFNYGIKDDSKSLSYISKAIKSKEFIKLMSNCSAGAFPSLNHKVLSLFRKDFWVDFLNYDNDDQ